MEEIKCPHCGESDLVRISDTEYKCKVCNTIIRDEKLSDILTILKENPDNFIGNLKFRLKNELSNQFVNFILVNELANKILNQNPEDDFALFLIAFLDRNRSKKQFKDKLNDFACKELKPYTAKEITKILLRFFEPAYKNEIKHFIDKQNLNLDFDESFNEIASKAPSLLDLFDTHIHRNVFVGCDEGDFEFVSQIISKLKETGLTFYFEPINYDGETDKTKTFLSASKNTDIKLFVNSQNLWNDRWWRNFLGDYADDETHAPFNDVIILNLEDGEISKFNKMSNSIIVNFNDNYNDLIRDLTNAIQKANNFINNKDFYEGNLKIADATKSINHKNYHKAKREIEDLLDQGISEVQLRKLLMRIYSEMDDISSKESKINYDALKDLCSEDELNELEELYPGYIDETNEFNQGLISYENKDFDTALRCFLKASKKNYGPALNKLGDIFYIGKGVTSDPAKGIKYYEKASKANVADADRMLGMAYFLGNKIEKNLNTALIYFKKGADKGNAFCQFKVAECYKNAIGTSKNINEAFKYYKMAALQNNIQAITELGLCYKHGFGVIQDRKNALECLNYAAKLGDEKAKRELFNF